MTATPWTPVGERFGATAKRFSARQKKKVARRDRLYLFDTTAFNDFRGARRSIGELRSLVLSQSPQDLHISIITAEEVLKGIVSAINKSRGRQQDPKRLLWWYDVLRETLRDFAAWSILPYDESADAAFRDIPLQFRRQNPQDSRIAAIALARRLTVITTNLRHFDRIPGLKVKDWTRGQ